MITGFTVRAPATVANVGPGFDTLAFALDWHNEIIVEPASQLDVTVEGEGAAEIPTDDSNLVVRAIARVMGATPRARIHLINRVPFGRGFGSSAAAIVGGLVAGAALLGDQADASDAAHRLAVEMEGHADNVTACLLGGFTVSLDGTRPARLDPPAAWRPLVAVAPAPLSTNAARRSLPDGVSFADAAVTAGRAARLVAAIASGDDAALLAATEDSLHQPARFVLAPDAGTLVAGLRSEGIAAFLSGAGPSVSALVTEAASAEARDALARYAPDGWSIHSPSFAHDGAQVVVGA